MQKPIRKSENLCGIQVIIVSEVPAGTVFDFAVFVAYLLQK
jgi:hypothetical protein